MARDFAKEIEQARDGLKPTLSKMDEVQRQFIAATGAFVRLWFWQQVEYLVKLQPKLTKSLGSAKLSEFKAAVKAHQDRTAEFVNTFVNDNRLWWHREPSRVPEEFGYTSYRVVENGVRLAVGSIAPILERFGYVSANNCGVSGGWREFDQTGSHQLPNSRPYYPFGLEWSEDMIRHIHEYDGLYAQAGQQMRAIAKLEGEKNTQEAADLWQQAP